MQESAKFPFNSSLLQLVQEKIIKCKSIQDAEDLQKIVPNCGSHPRSLDCLILPLIHRTAHKNVDINNEVKGQLLIVLQTLLQIHGQVELYQLKLICALLLEQIFNIEAIRTDLSEEHKLNIVQCLIAVINSTTSDALLQFYKKDNVLVAQMVFVAVSVIQQETYRKLRLKAIEFLMTVFQVNDEVDFDDVCLRKDVADVMFVMLPKVVVTLQKIIDGEETQGHQVISMSIKAMGRILCMIFEDYDKEETSMVTVDGLRKLMISMDQKKIADGMANDILGTNLKYKTLEEKSNYLKALNRSPQWLQLAIERLRLTLENLTKLVGNQNDAIRFEMATLSCNLIEKSIIVHLTPLLESAIALSQDSNIRVAQLCQRTLSTIIQRNSTTFMHQLESIFLVLVTKLQAIIYSGDEEKQLAALLLLKGVLQHLAASTLKTILTTPETLEEFVFVLLFICELDRPVDLLHEEHALRSVEDPVSTLKLPWKQFKHLQSQHLVQCLIEICETLGRSGAADLIFYHTMELFSSNTKHCNQLLVLFQFMLAIDGWGEASRCNMCLDELMSSRHWDLDVRANQSTSLEMAEFGESDWYESRTEGLYESAVSIRYTDMQWKNNVEDQLADGRININEAKFNVQHICLVLESIGLFSRALKNAFQPFVLRSLHRIMEKTGSSNYALYLAGAKALNDIRLALSYDSVAELIHDNADYISYFVNLSLKKVHKSNQALDVLSVVLKYSSMKSIPHLEHIIGTVMAESAKPQQSHNIAPFLRVFHMILTSICNWTHAISERAPAVVVADDESELCCKWLEMLHQQPETECVEEIVDTDADVTEEEADDVVSAPIEVPSHIQITVSILKRCIKYISIRNKMDKCLVLDALCVGLTVLGPWTNELLPMVHAVWSPFVERIKDRDVVILRKCFALLVVLGALAKDFLYARATRDIFNFVFEFLRSSCVDSLKRRKDPSFEKSQQFKFICEVLKELPSLLINLEVREIDLNHMLDVTSPYLHIDHHPKLQEEACNAMTKLLRYDGAAVYIKLKPWLEDTQYNDSVKHILSEII